SVIFGDMCLENDTSHEIFADNFIRNRGENFMKPLRKSGGSHFFDSLSGPPAFARRAAVFPGEFSTDRRLRGENG
ncbi:hypothetical protein, partial [uncultured Pseudoflavonifractor sp.]|uniref:hypothetical protein n=1 Tax=uncultured Pseudoflavonifractor sp. TaxID=1221379 RepID=UPI0025DCB44E